MKSFITEKNGKLSKLALYYIEDLSYSTLLKSLRKKDVKVNGKRISSDLDLVVGDKVDIYFTPKTTEKFTEIYLDKNVVVVYKKSGYLSESLYDDIAEKHNGARFIHRLDRNTDGVMIFALNKRAEEELIKGFKNHDFIKKYQAEVVGAPKKKEDVLTAFLLKDKESATVKIFDREVKGAVAIKTGYKLIEKKAETSVLEVTLYTGKTHQIRAHLSHVGYPIVGDGKYGDFAFNQRVGVKTQMLTAKSLTLKFSDKSFLAYLDGKKFEYKG